MTATDPVLDELEDRGLVTRVRDPAGRRRHRLELTTAGRRLQHRAAKAVAVAERDFLAPINAADRKQLRRLLLEVMQSRLSWLGDT